MAKLVDVDIQESAAVEAVAPSAENEVAAPKNTVVRSPALPRARPVEGTKLIARMLRTGALTAGGLFVASLALEALPPNEHVSVAIDLCRKVGASALIATPVVRLVVAGGALGSRGEWKYAAITAGILGLLALALGAGVAA